MFWGKFFFSEKKIFSPRKKKTSPPKIVEKNFFPRKMQLFLCLGLIWGKKLRKKLSGNDF